MRHFIQSALLLLAFLLPTAVNAHDFCVDGIYYNIYGNQVAVTYQGNDYWNGNPCTGDVTIPAIVTYNGTTYSVTAIGDWAFYGCSGLTSVTIPNSVTTIGDYAFDSCRGLTSVTIPNSVTTIGENAFYDCRGLTSVTIPNSVTTIGRHAFNSCSGLTSVTIPNSVTTIGAEAFHGTPWLENQVNQSDGLIYAGLVAYACMSTVTNIVLKDGTVGIAAEAFSGCSGLTSVTIPNSVISIGNYAFSSCSALESIKVEEGNPVYDSRDNCNAVIETATNTLISGCKNTIIPNSVTTIGEGAFAGCFDMASVAIPNSITTIGESAFAGCFNLTSVTIPNSVISIGNYAFGYSFLKDVYSYIIPSKISMGSKAFYRDDDYDYSSRTLHVPVGTVEAYQADTRWSQYFGSIVEMDPVPAGSLVLDKKNAVIIEGETLQLTATILLEYIACQAVAWASSDPSVASVDENGLVTAHRLGTAVITAMTTDGSNLSASCTVTVKSLSADNCIVVPDTAVLHGETVTIPVGLVNSDDVMAFQADVYLPEGFTLLDDGDGEPLITPSGRLTGDHVIMADRLEDGAVRVICYTPSASLIGGHEGDLFYLTVAVPQEAGGDYAIHVRNGRLTNSDYDELRLPDAGAVLTVNTFIPGDVNDSHTVTVTDIVCAAQYILHRDPSPFQFDAADMNGDGEVTVTDIMLIARLILNPAMNAPRRAPAVAAVTDRMSGMAVALPGGATRRVSLLLDNEMDYSAFQLDVNLPDGLTASNFALTGRTGSHILDVEDLGGGTVRALCYSPAMTTIGGHEGALLTFDVDGASPVQGDILVDGIELVTTACQTVKLGAFTVDANNLTAVSDPVAAKAVARIDYYNLTGQRLSQPATGVTLVVTTYTDGTRTTTKLHR